ncbi:MAG: septum formation protein Maf [Clostridia bacterium]|nr:septum formation protein Maf [Clostridia bacterium]
MKKLILASASPRRKQLLFDAGYDFTIETSDKEGVFDGITPPEKFAVRCAINKAEDVFSRQSGDDVVVLGADTIVCLDGKILEKPTDEKHAKKMLESLSGKTHQVITGYAIISSNMRETGKVVTKVTFNDLPKSIINDYLKSGLWQGKAGAYGIQDGYDLVKEFDGDYDNVVGLPVKAIDDTIKEFLK